MPDKHIVNACLALADRQKTGGVEEEVQIILEKRRGDTTFHRSFEASDTTAAINALAILTQDLAKMLDVPVIHVISILTLMLTDPGEKQA